MKYTVFPVYVIKAYRRNTRNGTFTLNLDTRSTWVTSRTGRFTPGREP